MNEVALIACCKSKRSTAVPVPAHDLYTGTLFRAQLAYARQVLGLDDAHIFVLSAKYRLVRITAVIEPYELTLMTMRKHERDTWASYVRNRLTVYCGGFDTLDKIWMLAGKVYRRPLSPSAPYALTEYFPRAEVVTPHPEHYGIGQQTAWYQAEIKRVQ